jgi:sugar O-acyltransferase (sialic acid O-acetyltransferase NeuD family)
MIPLLILGSGTFAQETLDIAEAAGGFRPIGFVNSLERQAPGATLEGLPIFWVDDLPYTSHECRLVAGIVSPRRRGFIELMQARGYEFATVAHPSATISRRAVLGSGCVVNAAAVISSWAELQAHTIVNRGALIGHHCRIGPYTSVGPGANLSGGLQIGTGVFLGSGATVRDHLTIGDGAVVGAGALVLRSLSENAAVLGTPGRAIAGGAETWRP